MKRTIKTFCLLLILSLASGTAQWLAHAQNGVAPCTIGRRAAPIGYWTWRAGAHVGVYLHATDFEPQEIAALLESLKLWDEASVENNSGVRFEYRGLTSEVRTEDDSLTIRRGLTVHREHLAEIQAASKRGDQIIAYATITIDPRLKGADSLRNALAHELGHSLGLLDCYSCGRESTAMWKLSAAGVKGPTSCDSAQVRAAYLQLKDFVRPAPAAAAADQSTVDEGEEPVEDDTPIVEPKPSRD